MQISGTYFKQKHIPKAARKETNAEKNNKFTLVFSGFSSSILKYTIAITHEKYIPIPSIHHISKNNMLKENNASSLSGVV